MNPIIVRQVAIGSGRPKICVPIVGTTQDAIVTEAATFNTIPVDVVEWRADWYDDVFDTKAVLETARYLSDALGDIPLLFTFRTANEGGEKAIAPDVYQSLLTEVAQSGDVDLIDVEVFLGDALTTDIVTAAHKANVFVVGSNHHFDRTPDQADIVARLSKMHTLGCDIPKIAVMPQNKQDVLTLLAATLEMSETIPDTPIITMSMASTGVISRLSGEVFGSALTFGAATTASAPGQIGVKDLDTVLSILHNSL